MEIKDVYAEIGLNYRFFLDWRHKILKGYLVTVAGLGSAISWSLTYGDATIKSFSWILPLIGTVVSFIFWILDYRNRDLYHVCTNTGAKIEEAENIKPEQGIYTGINTSKNILTRSIVMDGVFCLSTILFLVLTILLSFHVK